MAKPSIHNKLFRVFVLQLVLISTAAFLGVFFSGKIVEQVLVKEALEQEADFYWKLYDQNPQVALPNTRNLTGYLVDSDSPKLQPGLPEPLTNIDSNYSRVVINGTEPLVLRSQRDNTTLYLIFNEEQVASLTFFFGIAPLAIVLIVIYLVTWIAYRQSSRAISPIMKLAKAMQKFDIKHQTLKTLDLKSIRNTADADVVVLIDALEQFTDRLDSFIQRERNFTRDASHELRTPLAVIKGSLELLISRDYNEKEQAALKRIRNTADGMQTLLETLLLLSREAELQSPNEPVIINDLIKQELELIDSAIKRNDINISLNEKCLIEISAPEKVLSILLGNILHNAISYTKSGGVTITVDALTVTIQDTGPGMNEEELKRAFEPFYRSTTAGERQGYGLGLAIVKRLCEQFAWPLEAQSNTGQGTTINIRFPEAKVIATHSTNVA